MIRCALYARVSTEDQHNETQVHELKQYVATRGWTVTAIYQDEISGAKASRPGLQKLMEDARVRKFDAVLVWKLDRWGRSVADSVRTIQELVSLNIRFLAVTQNIDTDQSNPMATFLLHIMAAFAELERELIRERVKAGMAAAKRRGKPMGRKRVVFDRLKVQEMRAAGASLNQIAAAHGIGRGTVERALKAGGTQ